MSEKFNYTPEQEAAIKAGSTSVIVSAAAGSGKTKVLVERLIRQICDEVNPLSVSELTMVTFTNDAAAGMKKKLSEALSQKIRENPRNTRLRRELALIPIARISTVHSFCFDFIKENIVSLPVSPGFLIIDETRASVMLEKAAETVFERRFGFDKDYVLRNEIDFLSDIYNNEKRDSNNLRRICIEIYNKLRSTPFYKDFLFDCAQNYRSNLSDKLRNAYIKILTDELITAKNDAIKALDTAKYYGFERLADSLENEVRDISENVDNFIESTNNNTPFEKLIDIPLMIFPSFKPGTNPPEKDCNDEEKAAVKRITNIRKRYKEKLSDSYNGLHLFSAKDIEDDLAFNADVCEKLSKLINEIDDEFSKMKLKINALDFSDAEHMTLAILTEDTENVTINPSKIALEFAQKNKTVMVDEYQDTNDVQDMIFRLIAKSENGENPDNLYLVGDVKQSIYGFRAANPRIFIKLTKLAELTGKPRLIRLARNFRSSSEVVDFVNNLFSPLMKPDTFDGIDYRSDALVCGVSENDNLNRKPEFIVAENSISESAAVAKRINQLIEEKTPVYENGAYRPCKSGDFCILMRDRKNFNTFENALKIYGINTAKESTDTYLSSYEIQVLMNLLRVLDNPHQDIALASIMMSPMFGFSSEDMAQIRLIDRHGSFFDTIRKVSDEDNPQKLKIDKMLLVINNLKDLSLTVSVDILIQKIFDQTNFLNAVSYRFSDGSKKKANLRLMTQYAKSFSQNNLFSDVGGFVRYIENIVRMKGDFGAAVNTAASDEAVQIKTIHKSKGLEFAFVFLCDTAKNHNESDVKEPLLFHPSYGVASRFQQRLNEAGEISSMKRYKTFPQFVISRIKQNELRAESLRLLYVALTRAKERLFISFHEEDTKIFSEIDSKTDPQSCKNFLSLFACAFRDKKEGGVFRNEKIENYDDALFNTVIIGDNNNDQKEEKIERFYKPDMAAVERMTSVWAKKYPSFDVNKTAKLTVTEIALNSDVSKVYSVKNISLKFLNKDNAIASTPSLTASEKGTAMHRFLQKCDSKMTDVEIEAIRLQNLGVLSQLDAKSLNTSRLQEFFSSDFFKNRILSVPEEKIFREFKIYAKLCDIHLDERLKKEYNVSENSFLQGVADLVIEEHNGLTLIDYKTNANFFADEDGQTKEERFTHHMKKLYSLQIQIYAAAVSAIFAKPVNEAYLYSFALGKEIKIEV